MLRAHKQNVEQVAPQSPIRKFLGRVITDLGTEYQALGSMKWLTCTVNLNSELKIGVV